MLDPITFANHSPHIFRSELSSIKSNTDAVKSNTEVVVHSLSNVQKTLLDIEARVVTELSDKLMTSNQTVTQSIQNIGGNLNLAFVSLQADVKQLQQTQSKGVSEMKQLLQDLSLRIDANASIGRQVRRLHHTSGQPPTSCSQSFIQDIKMHRHLASLMSKPSALKALCDEFSDGQSTYRFPSDGKIQPPCTCQHRRITTRRSFKWGLGPFRLFTESKAESVHHESCQWAQYDMPKRSKAIGFAYQGFARLLRHAVIINLQLDYGAGGFSLGPGIVHYPVLDPAVYPPFKFVGYVSKAMWLLEATGTPLLWGRGMLCGALKLKVLQAFSTHISRACFNGTIVPRAVDPDGQTLLHCISQLVMVTYLRTFCYPSSYDMSPDLI